MRLWISSHRILIPVYLIRLLETGTFLSSAAFIAAGIHKLPGRLPVANLIPSVSFEYPYGNSHYLFAVYCVRNQYKYMPFPYIRKEAGKLFLVCGFFSLVPIVLAVLPEIDYTCVSLLMPDIMQHVFYFVGNPQRKPAGIAAVCQVVKFCPAFVFLSFKNKHAGPERNVIRQVRNRFKLHIVADCEFGASYFFCHFCHNNQSLNLLKYMKKEEIKKGRQETAFHIITTFL